MLRSRAHKLFLTSHWIFITARGFIHLSTNRYLILAGERCAHLKHREGGTRQLQKSVTLLNTKDLRWKVVKRKETSTVWHLNTAVLLPQLLPQ